MYGYTGAETKATSALRSRSYFRDRAVTIGVTSLSLHSTSTGATVKSSSHASVRAGRGRAAEQRARRRRRRGRQLLPGRGAPEQPGSSATPGHAARPNVRPGQVCDPARMTTEEPRKVLVVEDDQA